MKRQAGIALIQVLLVVAVLTLVITELVYRQRLTVQTTGYWNREAQGQHWNHAVAELAAADIRRFLAGDLAQPEWGAWSDPFELENGGRALYRIEPLQGRLNLNLLHPDAPPVADATRVADYLEKMGQDADWVERLRQWFGREAGLSAQLRARSPGHLTSGLPLVHESETRLFNDEVIPLSKLEITPWGAFLPASAPLDISRSDQDVLRLVYPDLTTDQWHGLEELRADGDFTVEDWLDSAVFSTVENPPDPDRFITGSRYFRVEARSQYLEQGYWQTRWIYVTEDGTLRTYQQHSMPFPSPLDEAWSTRNPDPPSAGAITE